MGRIKRVTPERLAKKDHYRSQLNVNRRLWAYGYNALVAHYDRTYMYGVRNFLVGRIEADLRDFLRRRLVEDPAFAESLEDYLLQYVDESLHSEAASMWEELGWENPFG
jgi:hypothetical protein